MRSQPKKIAVIRLDRLGDVVLTLPLAGILKNKFTEVSITMILREYTAPIGTNCKFADNVLIVEPGLKINEIVKLLKKEHFDIAFVVSPKFNIALAVLLSGIPVRIGTGNRWYSFLFNKRVSEHRSDVKFHEAEYNARMAASIIGSDVLLEPNIVNYGLSVPEQSLKIEKILRAANFSEEKRYLIIHPGSGGSAVDLPIGKYIELAERMQKENIPVICTGTTDERAICERVCAVSQGINLAGELSLEELMVIIKKCFIFVSNSTGPLHVAAALGKPTIAFFPKVKVCSKERWGAYSKDAYTFEPETNCGNCSVEKCLKVKCMDTIKMDLPAKIIEEIIRKA